MRRALAAALLAALLLAGCSAAPVEAAPTPETVPSTSPSPEPVSAPAPSEIPAPAPIPEPTPEPDDAELVRVRDFLPEIYIDLKYAAEDNFTGRRIYDFDEAWLRYGTVKKLASACEDLAAEGYALMI